MEKLELEIREINNYDEAFQYCQYLSSFMINTTLPNISVLGLPGKMINKYTLLCLGSSYFQIHIVDPKEKTIEEIETLSYAIDFGGSTDFQRIELYTKSQDLYTMKKRVSKMNSPAWFSYYKEIYSCYAKGDLKNKVYFL